MRIPLRLCQAGHGQPESVRLVPAHFSKIELSFLVYMFVKWYASLAYKVPTSKTL